MDDIITLLSLRSSLDERKTIANNIVAQYELPFSDDNIITMSEYCLYSFTEYYASNFIYLLLTTNVRMFIAVTYAILDHKMMFAHWLFVLLKCDVQGFQLGCGDVCNPNVKLVYCALYDYYGFDISDLALPNVVRNLIQKHIDGKGRHTKRAVKQP